MNVRSIRDQLKELYTQEMFVKDKTGVKIIEIIGASFVADEPIIFGNKNQDYIDRELKWYDSKSLFVSDIPGDTPEIWRQVSSKSGKINSNYGWCIYSPSNHHQYSSVLSTLMNHNYSRRAVMIYTRPSMQSDHKEDGMSDFICTNAVQYLIRDGKLEVVVQMRSNDVVFGYKNDLAWQIEVQRRLVQDLNKTMVILPGDIHWQVGSLHIYERHFKYLE